MPVMRACLARGGYTAAARVRTRASCAVPGVLTCGWTGVVVTGAGGLTADDCEGGATGGLAVVPGLGGGAGSALPLPLPIGAVPPSVVVVLLACAATCASPLVLGTALFGGFVTAYAALPMAISLS